MDLTYTEIISMGDGTSAAIERTVPVPEGRVLGINQVHYGAAYFPIEGVTLPPGGIWHWEPKAAEESPRIRVPDADEVKQLGGKRGKVASKATYSRVDPVTLIGDTEYEKATGPVAQVAPEEDI